MLSRPLKEQFVTAIRRLLRPVVRQLIAYGVTYPALNRMVRELYIEVADDHFALPFKRVTDSRVALVTGINRKEVSQLRQRRKKSSGEAVEVEDTVMTHVIGRWMAGPPYASAQGHPHRLPYEAASARAASFARLVREVGPDVPVRSVLDELLHIGVAELTPDGDVCLIREAHVPAVDTEGKLTLLGADPAEVFRTIMHNIEHPDAPRLQRKVVYDNIGADAVPELSKAAREVGEEFMRRANALLASYDRDRNPKAPGGKRLRIVLGTYYFEEDAAAPTPPPAADGRAKPPGRIRRSR
jgi:histone H3/H4